jgi:predicted small metal-binding protein
MVSINCKDIGFDCSFVATGATEKDAIRQFIEHADSAHTITVLSADVLYRLKRGIKK